jgi:predicted SnoaL-like aldol condensation-catalyzing enzyme
VPETSSRVPSDQERRNRDAAMEFLDLLINAPDGVDKAMALIGDRYRQHNPEVADGPAGVHAYLTRMRAENPGMRTEFKRAIVDGEFVVLHSHGRINDGDRGQAVIDIFRVEDGRVVEHWDVIQEIPEEAQNDNGMF